MKALKVLTIAAVCALAVVSVTGCKKEASPEAPLTEPTAVPTATPEPTPAPETVDFVLAPATPEPVKAEKLMRGFVISDADVEAVMMEDVAGWEGWSVVQVQYDGQPRTDYYAIPLKDEKDTEKAVAAVTVTLNENNVEAVSVRVFVGKEDTDHEAAKTFYAYAKDKFPFAVVGGLTEEAWAATNAEIDMSYERAEELAAKTTETRQMVGSFVFHTAFELASFDFYMK
ncbi:MAG: hypothetical protein Q4C53_00205 [Clostridia bacterium]|nr:hypothetical protein [Clostridia bacterium]